MENFGDFQRMYSLLIGDRPYATTTVDKKTRSCVFSQTPTMESKWSNLLSMEKEMVMKVITGKSDISAYDESIKKVESGRRRYDSAGSSRASIGFKKDCSPAVILPFFQSEAI